MKKILVFDQNAAIRTLLAHELADDGFEVLKEKKPEHLIDIIDKEKPEIVIMEIKLKDWDGLGLLERVRYRHYNLPVIVWSVSQKSRYDPRSMAADYYIVKSPRLEELKNKIAMVLESSRTLNVSNSRVQYGIPV